MLEYLKEQLERSNYWLTFSESKNAALVAFNVAIIAIIGRFGAKAVALMRVKRAAVCAAHNEKERSYPWKPCGAPCRIMS